MFVSIQDIMKIGQTALDGAHAAQRLGQSVAALEGRHVRAIALLRRIRQDPRLKSAFRHRRSLLDEIDGLLDQEPKG